jgi:hypothetical protein
VSFRTHDDRTPSKFIVPADNMKAAINMAWEHSYHALESENDDGDREGQQQVRRATSPVSANQSGFYLKDMDRLALKIP